MSGLALSAFDGMPDYMFVVALAAGLAARCAYTLYRKNPQRRPEVSGRPGHDRSTAGPDAEALLVASCKEFERLTNENPRDFSAWWGWGGALLHLARNKSGAEADAIYAQIDEKYSAALALRPDDMWLAANLLGVVYRRALCDPGEAGSRCITRACDLATHMIEGDAGAIGRPRRTAYYRILYWWSAVLQLRAECMPGEETDCLLRDAACQLEQATQDAGSESGALLLGWGRLLFARARRAQGAQAETLFKAAGEKFLASEPHLPEASAYNLACVAARLGNLDECRSWLQKSREPGILTSRDRMARDPDLASVRECDWFRELLAK